MPDPLEEWASKATLTTIPQMFRHTVERYGERPYLGAKLEKTYHYQTYAEIQTKVHAAARSLVALGLEPGERVAQLAGNRPEWVITDLGAQHAGLVHVPLYPTLAPDAIAYILNDCQARILVVGTAEQRERVRQVQAELGHLKTIVVLDSQPGELDFGEFLARGDESHQAEVERRVAALKATDLASLVYTSGTTGQPKGAMLRHGNFVSNALEAGSLIGVRSDDLELSFLPLSHVFERMLLYALTSVGAGIAYAESLETVAQNLQEVRPTVMASVPRLYEKLYARVQAGVQGNVRQKLFRWALDVGKRYFEAGQSKKIPRALQLERRFAYKLVFSKVHQRLGGRIRYLITGSAPLRREVGEFFLAAGFKLLEGYGLTETSPIVTVNPPESPRLGTVGRPLADVEVLIAPDGEILVRGPNVMAGYLNRPEDDSIDADGWFHTGDIGAFDQDGYLSITDRKKELLVLSNGKKVAPAPLEERLKASPYIEQAVAVGDNRNFVAALLVPDPVALGEKVGAPADLAALADNPQAVELLTQEATRLCADFSSYERVKKVALLPRELTEAAGDLTPTLKVKRRVVLERFAEQLENLYRE